jgi:hypothetical protein
MVGSNSLRDRRISTHVAMLVVGLMTIGIVVAHPPVATAACPNESLRGGPSALLPDCRAYEQVTPTDAGDRFPLGLESLINFFPTSMTTSDGDSIVFTTNGTPYATPEGPTGNHDFYEATRSPAGWVLNRLLTPTGRQSAYPEPGGVSADHQYTFIAAKRPQSPGEFVGELGENRPPGVLQGNVVYLARPDRSFELLGVGSLGSEPLSRGLFISPGGEHVVFATGGTACQSQSICDVKQLETSAPPTGTGAVYDRSALGGPTRVISLLPGNVTPAPEELGEFLGASADGSAVAFTLQEPGTGVPGTTLYLRINNAVTKVVKSGGFTFAGIRGHFVFYLSAGDVFRYDFDLGTTTQVTETGDAELANIDDEGGTVYYVSHSALPGTAAEAGQPNLYVWDQTRENSAFVATVSPADLEGEPALNRWTFAVSADANAGPGPGGESSRISGDGSVLAFESHASLTGYPSEGHAEIYVYDGRAGTLRCASCNPEGQPATSDARLEAYRQLGGQSGALSIVQSLTGDGHHLFFETPEHLLRRDVDGVNDVYEWSDEEAAAPSLSLISSGLSALVSNPLTPIEPNVMFAVSSEGHDVFFRTTDALTGESEPGGGYAMYDARVGGGIAEPAVSLCAKEQCTAEVAGLGPQQLAGSRALRGSGNEKPSTSKRRCRPVKRHGKRPPTRRCKGKSHSAKHHAKKGAK